MRNSIVDEKEETINKNYKVSPRSYSIFVEMICKGAVVIMKKNLIYVDAYPYYICLLLGVIGSTVLVFVMYKLGLFGVAWNENNIQSFYLSNLPLLPQDLIFLVSFLPAITIVVKKRKSDVVTLSLTEFRLCFGVILVVLSFVFAFLFYYRDYGSSFFTVIVLLLYLPMIIQWIFVEKKKAYLT